MTCDLQSIKDPLDEALKARFICFVDNEAVFKAFFRIKDDELTCTFLRHTRYLKK